MPWPFASLWDTSLTYEQFVRASQQHCDLWTGVYRTAKVPAWAVTQAAALGRRFRFVAIAEDWCGDASSTIPVVVRFAEATGNEVRVLRRDEHPEVMDRYLSPAGARAIPVVVVLTDAMEEVGHWGSRPAELQAFVTAQRQQGLRTKEYFPDVRRWYAKDRGESTLREILAVMAGGG
jgi:thioredoxin family protein